MLFASDDEGNRVLATEKGKAKCPVCGQPVVARRGPHTIWHWAHTSGCGCGPSQRGETFWHLSWKLSVPPEAREVHRGGHRVDIVGRSGRVVELQHSRIDPGALGDRERSFGDMVWIFDSSSFARYLKVDEVRPSEQDDGIGRCDLMWPKPWREIIACRRSLYMDLDPILPGLIYQVDSKWNAPDRRKLSGRLYYRSDLVSWFLYPGYSTESLPFKRVRVLSGLRASGPALRKDIAKKKGVTAWVTDDSLVRWRWLAQTMLDVNKLSRMVVDNQDVLVVIPRSIRGDTAQLDGFQPPAIDRALSLGRSVYVWCKGAWYTPTGRVVWDSEPYDDSDWGVFAEMPGDEMLKGLLKVKRTYGRD